MSQQFYSLRVSQVERQTPKAVAITLEIPETLKEKYIYRNGQYITIKKTIAGEELRRSYSICSAWQAKEAFQIAVKEVEGGKMSPFLNRQLNPGDFIEVSTPEGNFIWDSGQLHEEANVFLYAGGSGITPIFGILKQLLLTSTKLVHLAYANKNPDEIIFRDELKWWQKKFPDQLYITNFIEENGERFEKALPGRISSTWFNEQDLGDLKSSHHYICGPGPMMEFVKSQLQLLGVPHNLIHMEFFEAPDEELEDTSAPFSGNAQVTVLLDGVESNLEINESETILSAMLKAGLDAPYSCQGGVCATCRALVDDGEVYLSQNLGITDGEIQEGFTLTCSSYPRSSKIKINFDAA
ncbi:MAG: 2Fe-2S iron-sulfur cluster-binding protein [Luteibaculum sp.]